MTLARGQRRAVSKRFIRPLFFCWQAFVARTCLMVLAVVGGTTLLRPSGGWQEFMTVFVAVLIASSLFDLAFIVWNRRRIDEFIQAHADEIRFQG